MWIADRWKDYEVMDTSSGEKLEEGRKLSKDEIQRKLDS